MADRINFKFDYNGQKHRFASALLDDELFRAVQAKVDTIVKAEDYKLYWKDQDSNVVLDSVADLNAAIEYAKCTKKNDSKFPCVVLVVNVVIPLVTALFAAMKQMVNEDEAEDAKKETEAFEAAVVAEVEQQPHDVFISYRRGENGKKLAALVKVLLQLKGYKVAIDYDDKREDSTLKDIRAAKHFILVLAPISDENGFIDKNWVFQELRVAFELKKNIIPIFDPRFEYFEGLVPKDLHQLFEYNSIRWVHAHQEKTMERVEHYIKENLGVPQAELAERRRVEKNNEREAARQLEKQQKTEMSVTEEEMYAKVEEETATQRAATVEPEENRSLSTFQECILEERFWKRGCSIYPQKQEMEEIAVITAMRADEVNEWFKARRAEMRRVAVIKTKNDNKIRSKVATTASEYQRLLQLLATDNEYQKALFQVLFGQRTVEEIKAQKQAQEATAATVSAVSKSDSKNDEESVTPTVEQEWVRLEAEWKEEVASAVAESEKLNSAEVASDCLGSNEHEETEEEDEEENDDDEDEEMRTWNEELDREIAYLEKQISAEVPSDCLDEHEETEQEDEEELKDEHLEESDEEDDEDEETTIECDCDNCEDCSNEEDEDDLSTAYEPSLARSEDMCETAVEMTDDVNILPKTQLTKKHELQAREAAIEAREENLARRMAEFAVMMEEIEGKKTALKGRVEEVEEADNDDIHEKLDDIEERLEAIEDMY